MPSIPLSPLARKGLKARAHFLDPVVIIGDAGLTPAVLAEIERNLVAHELIKVRVAGAEREERETLLSSICSATTAIPVQHIGKLLVIYRAADKPIPPERPSPATKKVSRSPTSRAKRNPLSGRLVGARPGAVPISSRKSPKGERPPRTERVRKSGQRSTKKPFQGS